jgi:hypothetical protein
MTAVTRGPSAASDGTGHCKKSPGLLCQRVELRYACIAEHQDLWPVAVLCEGLDVSRSGFYEYLLRHAKASGDAEEVAL